MLTFNFRSENYDILISYVDDGVFADAQWFLKNVLKKNSVSLLRSEILGALRSFHTIRRIQTGCGSYTLPMLKDFSFCTKT